MAKKVDPAKAKAAKQRKMAIVLGVLLLAVVAFQGPKTLKMLKGPAAPATAEVAAPPAAAAPAATPEAVVPPLGTPAAATGAPASTAQPAVLASSDMLAVGPGQLASFERFESKDPFRQQVDTPGPVASAEAGETHADAAQPAETPPAKTPVETGAGPAPETGSVVPVEPASESPAPPAKFEAPAVPPATATTISINGVEGVVEVAKEFPLADPIFLLVSTAADGKSAEIGIAGGRYANGEPTITLKLGKPLTLQNTADGSRYELVLRTVAGFAPVAPKK
jgi:hypothetical protein